MTKSITPFILFGASKPWVPPPWTTTDDRVRGGASQSYLSALPNNCARFYGHLDISTLGGAGFASQFSPLDDDGESDESASWDLSAYDGIEVVVGKADGKVYTFILKDEMPPEKREDGREKAAVNWEIEFRASNDKDDEEAENKGSSNNSSDTTIWVPWDEFKPTFRGREKRDAGQLKTNRIKRVGLMMRSYFGKQEGDFSIDLKSMCARKATSVDAQRTATLSMRGVAEQGWSKSVFDFCAIL